MCSQRKPGITNNKQYAVTNSTCIVTGGAGFIGSHIVDTLANPLFNNKVLIVDNLRTGNLQNISHHFHTNDLKNVTSAETQQERQRVIQSCTQLDISDVLFPSTKKSVTFCKIDICNPGMIHSLFDMFNPTHIFHLAAMVSVPESLDKPGITHEINVNGTFNILFSSYKLNSVKSVVFSSSCAVYGNPASDLLPLKESAPLRPLSPYALSKQIGEQYCHLFSDMYGLPCTSLRYFNVYGPRQDKNSDYAAVIPNFLHNALNGRPLSIFGDGLQTRDFVYVDDVVNANMFAAIHNETSEHSSYGCCYNVGTGQGIQIKQLAAYIDQIIDHKKTHIQYHPKRKGDVSESYADSTSLQKTGFQIKYNIHEGLINLIQKING